MHAFITVSGHPLVPRSTLRAGVRLVPHGMSTELLHGFLRDLKAKDAATKGVSE